MEKNQENIQLLAKTNMEKKGTVTTSKLQAEQKRLAELTDEEFNKQWNVAFPPAVDDDIDDDIIVVVVGNATETKGRLAKQGDFAYTITDAKTGKRYIVSRQELHSFGGDIDLALIGATITARNKGVSELSEHHLPSLEVLNCKLDFSNPLVARVVGRIADARADNRVLADTERLKKNKQAEAEFASGGEARLN